MNAYWMRWIDFSRLPSLYRMVASAPGELTPGGLDSQAISRGAFLLPSGEPMGRANRYHHRRTLERFGMIVRRGGRYYENLPPNEHETMLADAGGLGLSEGQRILLSDRVIQNEDCYSVFWSSFVPERKPCSVKEFVQSARPILLHVEEPPEAMGRERRYGSSILLRSTQEGCKGVFHEGYRAVQAVHFGMRRWGTEQLRFLDELYQVGRGHYIFPIEANSCRNPEIIDKHLCRTLRFSDDWAMPRVGDLLLTVATKLKIPISDVRTGCMSG